MGVGFVCNAEASSNYPRLLIILVAKAQLARYHVAAGRQHTATLDIQFLQELYKLLTAKA